MGLAKFFAKLDRDRTDIKGIKIDLQKINSRLSNIEKDHIKVSADLNYLQKESNNYFEKPSRSKR